MRYNNKAIVAEKLFCAAAARRLSAVHFGTAAPPCSEGGLRRRLTEENTIESERNDENEKNIPA